METLLLSMAGRASPSFTSVLLQDGMNEAATGFDPFLVPLMLLIAVTTAFTLKIIDITIRAIAGAFKAFVETGLALAGLIGIMILVASVTVMLRLLT